MKYEAFLKNLWLNKIESNIYVHLLSNKKKSLSQLSQELDIHRPQLYKTLPYMQEMWLISTIIVWKRKYFIAENPKILQTYFQNLKNDYESYIPQIENMYSNNFSRPVFKHSSWKTAIRNIFLDIAHTLEVWGTFYRYSARNNVWETSIPMKEYEKYKLIRKKKQLQRMVITNTYLDNLKEKKLDKDVVVVSEKFDLFEDNITKIIYAHKVAIIDYNTEECFVIESAVFAWFEKKIFLLLFKLMRQIHE